MATKKYVSLSKLSSFLNNLKTIFATKAEVSGKADASHNHDDRYYSQSDIDTKVSTINTSILNIVNGTTTVGKASSADSATKATQDGEGSVISSTYETKTNVTLKFDEAKSYADSAATQVKNDLLNGAGDAYDTLKELGDLIKENADTIGALETVAANKAEKTHTHTISDVTSLQTVLDGKADDSHNHDDRYYTEEEINNMVFVSTNSIDTICGQTIQVANLSEVTF